MGKKKVTLNDLSEAIENLKKIFKEGFAMMNKHFDRIDAHLDRMENNQKIILSMLDGKRPRKITN